MPENTPTPPDPLPAPARPIQRIILETVLVFLIGCTALGIAWEMGHFDVGWIIAIIIWVIGDPLLEIIRVVQSRRG